MSKKMKRILTIVFSLILIISMIAGVILTTQLLYKFNHRTTDEILAEKNEVKIGEETVFYVDLTQNTNKLEQMSQLTQNNKTKNDETENLAKTEKEKNDTEASVFQQINQDYFDMEFDLNSGTAIIDGNKIDIADLLDITEDEKNQLLSSTDEFYNYLNENMTGDLEYEDGTIKVENPYSTNAIMIKTPNLTEIEEGGDIQSIVKVADDVYCVHYENAEDTKEGYNILKNDELVSNISTDAKIKSLDNADVEEKSETFQMDEIETLGVSNNNYAWGVNSTGLRRYLNKLNYGNNETEIKVAVFDSGVRTTHEIFTNETTGDRLDTTYSYNFVDDNTNIADDNGHGTMVAGIIAQSTSNNVKIVPIKILDSEGNGILSNALEGLAQIVNYVDVINLSFGASKSEMGSDIITMADGVLKQLYDSGKVIVCSSGNDGKEDVYYPASSSYTFAVSAIDIDKNIASFSNYGDTIDFAAPGKSLVLPYYTGDNLYNIDFDTTSEEYRKNSGTSFAAPFVTAAVSLIKTENDNATVEQIKNILIANTDDLGETGKDKYYGYGSINFDSNMFAKPVIASVNTPEEWGKENVVEVYAVCGNEIENWSYTYSQEPPSDSDWRAFESPSTLVIVRLTVLENRDFYLWFKDAEGNITSQVATTKYVDRVEPTITTQLTASENNSTGFTTTVSVQDDQSGLARIDWYYKKDTDTDYTKVTDTYATSGTGETNNVEKTHQFSNLENNTNYHVYAEIYDIAGNFVTTNEITVSILEEEDNTNTNTGNTNTGNTNTNTNNTSTGNTNASNTNTENTNTDNTNTNTSNTNTGNTNTNTENTNTGNTNTNTENTNTGNTNTNTNNTNTEGTNTNTENTNQGNTNTNLNNTNTGNINTNTGNNNTNTNGGNSYLGGINKGNNTSLNSIPSKIDNSTASKTLPKTGNNKLIILSAIILLIAGIFTYIKYRKLKDIK